MRISAQLWRCRSRLGGIRSCWPRTVRRIQIDAGLWVRRKLRPPKMQQSRTRRAYVVELIQIDGCEHHWFEDRAPMCTALVFVALAPEFQTRSGSRIEAGMSRCP
jgi:hypothetical protein